MKRPMTDEDIRRVAHIAEDAFWADVARSFPHVKTGDLSVESTIRFRDACALVIREWLEQNTPEMTEEERELLHRAARVVLEHGVDAIGTTPILIADYLDTLASEPMDPAPAPPERELQPPHVTMSEKGWHWARFAEQLPTHNGWRATWEFPGFLHWTHPALDLSLVATPDWESRGNPEITCDLQDRGGEQMQFGGRRWDVPHPWPRETRTPESYMAIVAPQLDALSAIADEYRNAARRTLLDADLEDEGDFEVDPGASVIAINEELPGAWVTASLWIDQRDLTGEPLKPPKPSPATAADLGLTSLTLANYQVTALINALVEHTNGHDLATEMDWTKEPASVVLRDTGITCHPAFKPLVDYYLTIAPDKRMKGA